MSSTRCPSCKNRVLQKSGSETRIRVQGPIVVGEDGICRGQCHWCRGPIALPLTMTKSLEPAEERLVIVERGRIPVKES